MSLTKRQLKNVKKFDKGKLLLTDQFSYKGYDINCKINIEIFCGQLPNPRIGQMEIAELFLEKMKKSFYKIDEL